MVEAIQQKEGSMVRETEKQIAVLMGGELLTTLGDTDPAKQAERERLHTTINAYLEGRNPKEKRALAEAILKNIPPEKQISALEDLPPILDPYIDISTISDRQYKIKDFTTTRLLSLFLQNPSLTAITFGLTDSARASLVKVVNSEQERGKIPKIAEVIAGVIKKGNNGDLSLVSDDIGKLLRLFEPETRHVAFELLASVGEAATGVSEEKLDNYYDRVLLLLGGSDRKYALTGYDLHYLDTGVFEGFSRTGEVLKRWMDCNERIKKRVQAKKTEKLLEGDASLANELSDRYYVTARYYYLGELALASACVSEGDDQRLSRLKNPDLEELLKADKEIAAKAILVFYNSNSPSLGKDSLGSEDLLKDRNKNLLFLAQRVFRFLVENFDPDQLPTGFKLSEIKDLRNRWYTTQGLRLAGETLGIDWDEVKTWDEVRQIIKPQTTQTAIKP